MNTVKGFLVTVLVVVALAGISLGGWQLGWWFKTQDTNRQVKLDNRNTGAQTAWRDEVERGIRDYALLSDANPAQKNAVRNQTCDLIGRLVSVYKSDNIVQFESEHC